MYPPPASEKAQAQPYNPTGFPVTYNNNTKYPASSVPLHPQPPPTAEAEWSTGLFDCFSNFKNCCITCWCPCITFGQVAEIVDRGSTSCGASGALYTLISCVLGCGCLYSCYYRSKMRRQYMLKETPCCDCLVHCCCEPCALCQEYRELENRGFDMLRGWQDPAAAGVAMNPTPPTAVNMTR